MVKHDHSGFLDLFACLMSPVTEAEQYKSQYIYDLY